MTTLFDIAKSAQGGAAFEALARQFSLDPKQAESAVQALLPAFTLAFRQMAVDPLAFANLAGAIGSGRYAPFFDGTATPASPVPDNVVAQLFGSEEVGRQVASQASAMTGIGTQVVQQMLPVLAAMLVGGMFRLATVDGFADFLRQWSDALRSMQPRKTAAPTNPWSAWAEVVSASLGARPAPPKPEPAANPFEAWSGLMTSMLGPSAPPAPPPASPNPAQALTRMFETGLEVQSQYLKSLEPLFAASWGKPPPEGGTPPA